MCIRDRFSGVLTGGNGRPEAEAATNTYDFNVPSGENDLDVSVALSTDPNDTFIAQLDDPSGQTVAYSTNVEGTSSHGIPTGSPSVNLYKVNPVSGPWTLIVEWLNPVTGLELREPFTGTIQYNQVDVTNNLPNGSALLVSGSSQKYLSLIHI